MKRIALLEDDLYFVDLLSPALLAIEDMIGEKIDIEHVVTQRAVENGINSQDANYFDAIVLDYFAQDGTFHVFDIEKFGPEKVVAISSIADKNTKAQERGVTRSVQKNRFKLGSSVQSIVAHVSEILSE